MLSGLNGYCSNYRKNFTKNNCRAKFLQMQAVSACRLDFAQCSVFHRIFCMETFEKPTHEELARYLKALGRLIKAESQRLEAIYELSKVGPDDFLRLHVESERLNAWSSYFEGRNGVI